METKPVNKIRESDLKGKSIQEIRKILIWLKDEDLNLSHYEMIRRNIVRLVLFKYEHPEEYNKKFNILGNQKRERNVNKTKKRAPKST